MYRVYIFEASVKQILMDEYSNSISFNVDSLEEAKQNFWYFEKKGFTVIVEPVKDGD